MLEKINEFTDGRPQLIVNPIILPVPQAAIANYPIFCVDDASGNVS